MKNVEFIKKLNLILEIVFWISIVILIATTILLKPLSDLDEIWNYNFSKNVLEGRMPYKDFNIVVMPIVPYIGSIFLMIFGNQMLSMRIFAIITNFLILFVFYNILNKLKLDKNISKIIIIELLYLLERHLRIDYNFFTLLILLCIIFLEIKNIENLHKISHKADIIIGLLAGLCIGCKQTVGICISIVTIFYQIILVKDKETLKIYLRKMLDRIIGVVIIVFSLCIYFTVFNIWNDFIDYAILGIKDFSNKTPYLRLITMEKWYIKILSILVPLYLIVDLIIIFIKKFITKKELDIKNVIILAYSWAFIILIYPISDRIHFLVGSIPALIGIIYSIFYPLLDKDKRRIVIEFYTQIMTLVIAICAIMCINSIYKMYKSIDNRIELKHFESIDADSEFVSNALEVDSYITNQNNKVYILDSTAAAYMIPIDQYNKNYDMFNKGNLGSKGEDGIIEEIKNMENTQILILQDQYSRNWQTPFKVIDYVKNNLNKIGQTGRFDIYEK